MNGSIVKKIKKLGGNTDAVCAGKNFVENWQSIRFAHHLYDRDWDVYGIYPDHYFVCTTDSDQNNPTVYSTDHEVYFQEIDNKGNLEEFLERFMTKEEFLEVVTEYLIGKVRE